MLFAVSVIVKMLMRAPVLLGSRKTKYPTPAYIRMKYGGASLYPVLESTYDVLCAKHLIHGHNVAIGTS
jgi:hypothetical protein